MQTQLPQLGTMLMAAVITAWVGGWVVPAFAEKAPVAQTGHKDGRCPAGKFPASGQTMAYQADINDGTSDNFVDVPDDGTLEAGGRPCAIETMGMGPSPTATLSSRGRRRVMTGVFMTRITAILGRVA